MKRKKSKTTNTNHFTAKARLKTPCECGSWWTQLVKTRDEKQFGHQCLQCGRLSLWDKPQKPTP